MGYIADLPVAIQGNTLHIPAYLLPISGVDLVLGVPWLNTLGPHIADYNALSLKFYVKDSFVTLYGEQPKGPSQAQFHHIKRFHHTDAIATDFTLHFDKVVPQNNTFPDDLPTDIAAILHQFVDVFEEPKSLPPVRFQDHVINLMEGSNPVKVRPYRYPHSQKAQIETMVNDMLSQSIIQPSISPFSSPVLLVKKKDEVSKFLYIICFFPAIVIILAEIQICGNVS
ncbi:retrotransposon-related protein [Trifolium pratense]|uniref:Retrotransposon-related protein n=1 Tax=Trifolium pratense TaxID=57577 RepID=A0A2K3PIF5_TRIPR|nr:retrotransposon-related protein [Trifolium pratense]